MTKSSYDRDKYDASIGYKRVGLTQKTIDHGYMQSTSIQIEAACKDLKHDEIIHKTLYG